MSLDRIFTGAIAGLIMVTPAAGLIDLSSSLCFGLFGAVVCRRALRIKFMSFARGWNWMDNDDTFATRSVGGFLGTISAGLSLKKQWQHIEESQSSVGSFSMETSVGRVSRLSKR